ncbi:MAG: class IV adenylate cyclase [Acidobacteria bacterium]|nr:class IV adenylate cyclase [Acidobacteriota bacterium]
MRNRETEVKIRIADVRTVKEQLRKLGLPLLHRRSLEDNVLYDTPDRALRRIRSILRLRHYRSHWWLTYKGTPFPDPHYKSRLELEIEIQQPRVTASLLQALGFQPVFRYQKYRSQYGNINPRRRESRRRDRREMIEVSLDETPIGNFVELEGPPPVIDRVARWLGYTRANYLTASYGALYLEECREKNIPPGDMVFNSPRSRKTGKL